MSNLKEIAPCTYILPKEGKMQVPGLIIASKLLLENSDIETTKKLFIEAESKLASARGKGLLHRNTAARKISRLSARIKAIS